MKKLLWLIPLLMSLLLVMPVFGQSFTGYTDTDISMDYVNTIDSTAIVPNTSIQISNTSPIGYIQTRLNRSGFTKTVFIKYGAVDKPIKIPI